MHSCLFALVDSRVKRRFCDCTVSIEVTEAELTRISAIFLFYTVDRFSVFCILLVDEDFALPTTLHFFLFPNVSLRSSVSKLALQRSSQISSICFAPTEAVPASNHSYVRWPTTGLPCCCLVGFLGPIIVLYQSRFVVQFPRPCNKLQLYEQMCICPPLLAARVSIYRVNLMCFRIFCCQSTIVSILLFDSELGSICNFIGKLKPVSIFWSFIFYYAPSVKNIQVIRRAKYNNYIPC